MSILRTPCATPQHRERIDVDTVSRQTHRSSRPSLRWGRTFLIASALVAVMTLSWLGAAGASSALGGQTTAQYASTASSHLPVRPACAGVPFPCK